LIYLTLLIKMYLFYNIAVVNSSRLFYNALFD
jgi:hypothetical protein